MSNYLLFRPSSPSYPLLKWREDDKGRKWPESRVEALWWNQMRCKILAKAEEAQFSPPVVCELCDAPLQTDGNCHQTIGVLFFAHTALAFKLYAPNKHQRSDSDTFWLHGYPANAYNLRELERVMTKRNGREIGDCGLGLCICGAFCPPCEEFLSKTYYSGRAANISERPTFPDSSVIFDLLHSQTRNSSSDLLSQRYRKRYRATLESVHYSLLFRTDAPGFPACESGNAQLPGPGFRRPLDYSEGLERKQIVEIKAHVSFGPEGAQVTRRTSKVKRRPGLVLLGPLRAMDLACSFPVSTDTAPSLWSSFSATEKLEKEPSSSGFGADCAKIFALTEQLEKKLQRGCH